jgi:hypothetical protein
MNILWHTWEPGLDGDGKTSGGGGAWTKFLFDQFGKAGHKTFWFKSHVPRESVDWIPTFDVDVAVFCWRWELPNLPQYEDRNNCYDRQNKLIEWCIRKKIPFLIHDQDLKMTFEARDWITTNGGVIASPSFYPDPGEVVLHYPNPYKFDKVTFQFQDAKLVYIGNNYERLEQAIRFLVPFSEKYPTEVYGNWTEDGPGRNPRTTMGMMPNVNFKGRLDQANVIETMKQTKATILLHKPEYGSRGFVTIRWAEAATAGCLPFIPAEFNLPREYANILDKLRVRDGYQLRDKFRNIYPIEDEILIDAFRELVDKYMRPEPWLEQLERMAK